jgi:quercetin dioxygenase-like cupin family protein
MAIFSARNSPATPWERHPSGDELVQVVDGATILHVVSDDGPLSYPLSAGMVVIVPQNMWHRFHAPDGVTLVTATPKPTEHLTVDVEDPRTLADTQRVAATEHKWR